MYEFDQNLANRIAKTVEMKYQLTKMLFGGTEEEAMEIEEKIRSEVLERTDSRSVAKGVIVFLPLLLEHQAISKFQNKTRLNIRNIAPEILTPKEAALWAQRDCMLTELEKNQVQEILTDILANQNRFTNS